LWIEKISDVAIDERSAKGNPQPEAQSVKINLHPRAAHTDDPKTLGLQCVGRARAAPRGVALKSCPPAVGFAKWMPSDVNDT
jgi:hypothetical protein